MYLTKLELKQLELLKRKTPSERFLLMINLINAQIQAMKAGIRHTKGDISEEEVNKCLQQKMRQIYINKNYLKTWTNRLNLQKEFAEIK